MKIPLLVIAGILLIAAAAYHFHEPAPSPKSYTESQKSPILNFLEKGSRMQSLTAQGVNIMNFESELASLNASWDVLKNTSWPSGYDDEKRFIEEALLGWKLVQIEWRAKIDRASGYDSGQYTSDYYDFKRHFSWYDKSFEAVLDAARNGDDKEERIKVYMAGADKLFGMAKQKLYGKLN